MQVFVSGDFFSPFLKKFIQRVCSFQSVVFLNVLNISLTKYAYECVSLNDKYNSLVRACKDHKHATTADYPSYVC